MQTVLKIAHFVFILFQIVVTFYFLLPTFLFLFHLFRGKNKNGYLQYKTQTDKDFDFAAIVTAHKDTRFILPVIDSFRKQLYKNFVVYVIADDCDVSELPASNGQVKIIKPPEALHAKIKSLKYGMDHFVRGHDVLVVFDTDNLVHPGYLHYLNEYFRRGFKVVQTHMLSKNTDSVYAKLDSIGHIYNTFIERQARMELGLSSSILGLGIAIETGLYKQVMYKDSLGGFDKKLQAEIIKNIPQLAFAKEAIVYDEKVEDGNTFEKQRTRWIYTYFKYFQDNLEIFKTGLRRFNFNLIFFGFNAIRPPLFITIGIAILCLFANLFINIKLALAWVGILILFTTTFILIVLTQSRQKGMGKALLYIPEMIFRQIKAFLKIKKASKNFLKTEHIKVTYIDDLLKNETV